MSVLDPLYDPEDFAGEIKRFEQYAADAPTSYLYHHVLKKATIAKDHEVIDWMINVEYDNQDFIELDSKLITELLDISVIDNSDPKTTKVLVEKLCDLYPI